jgi:UDP-glucose 4-epimerase
MHGLKTTILRLFNVYGTRMRKDQYGGVIARFIERIRSGKPPIIYGDGQQSRDFIHVQDVVDGMKLTIGNNKAAGQTFNIGSGEPTTINQLAQLLTRFVGTKELTPEHQPARRGDLKHSYANIEKAKNDLDFKPRIRLEEGLSNLAK